MSFIPPSDWLFSQNTRPSFQADISFRRIVDCNTPFAALFGFESREELLAPAIDSFPLVPLSGEELLKRFEKNFLDRFEDLFRRRDGSVFWAEISAIIAPDDTSILGVLRDITERKTEELFLKEKNASLAMLSEIGADLMADLDTDTLLQKVLRYATSSLNTEHGSISFVDMDTGDRYVRWSQGSLFAAYKGVRIPFGRGLGSEVISSGKRRIVEDYKNYPNRLLDRDFDVISTVVGVPLRWKAEVFGYLSVYYEGEPREIEEKRLEHLDQFAFLASMALRNARLYEEARREIEERRRLEQQLREATLEAERANRAKSEFLARMSHEIRTPLNILTGMSDLLLETHSDCALKESVEMIAQAGKFLTEMVNDILDFSKIEAGRVELEVIPFSLSALLKEIGKMFSFHAEQKGILFRSITDSTLPDLLRGDPLRLKQILFNLLGNAVKFTPKGEVRLTVTGSDVKNGRVSIRFIVSDTGIGMRPEMLDDIFEPYHQGAGSVARRFGGSGLGLPISRMLAELMEGSLSVESILGKGSSFMLSLALEAARTPSGEAEGSDDAERALPENLSILVADDNVMNRTLIKKLLSLPGWTVLMASDGQEALEIAQRNGPDVIILDLEMPRMDGLSAARAIREYEADFGRRSLILGLSGYALSEIVSDCLEAGMDDCLVKPARKQALLGRIAECYCDSLRQEVFKTGGNSGKSLRQSTDQKAVSEAAMRSVFLSDNGN